MKRAQDHPTFFSRMLMMTWVLCVPSPVASQALRAMTEPVGDPVAAHLLAAQTACIRSASERDGQHGKSGDASEHGGL